MSGIGAGFKALNIGAKLIGAGDFVKKMPWQVWAVAALIFVAGLGKCMHNGAVKDFGKQQYDRGYTTAKVEDAAAAVKIAAAANALSAKARSLNDEANRAISHRADTVRLRGPGRAVCLSSPAIPRSAGGRQPAGGRGDDPPAGLPDQGWIALPFDYAIEQAEVCDLNRREVLTWRDWYGQQVKIWSR